MDVDPADGVASDLGPTSTVPETSTAAPSGEDPPIFLYGRPFVVSDDAPTTDIQETASSWFDSSASESLLRLENSSTCLDIFLEFW
ncbi:hypothetical protein CTI12_AA529370 [Artemisia annua]|uniref:Uncharacterized protein n=1 Tax=Artemisia annua TaxID=35608 RepID=A0A2U1L4S1_ARTAN|nr:hypothetical protein CTI12_AA529370 [Artemisia annua]